MDEEEERAGEQQVFMAATHRQQLGALVSHVIRHGPLALPGFDRTNQVTSSCIDCDSSAEAATTSRSHWQLSHDVTATLADLIVPSPGKNLLGELLAVRPVDTDSRERHQEHAELPHCTVALHPPEPSVVTRLCKSRTCFCSCSNLITCTLARQHYTGV